MRAARRRRQPRWVARVYVSGSSKELHGVYAAVTVAYDGATGSQLWADRYTGPPGGSGFATSLALRSDGQRVYVGGTSQGATGTGRFTTLAYDASGARLWVTRDTDKEAPRGTGIYVGAIADGAASTRSPRPSQPWPATGTTGQPPTTRRAASGCGRPATRAPAPIAGERSQ